MQVAPMDQHGYFSLGPSASHLCAMMEKADCIIVEVNENMPRCLGGFEDSVHISKVDMIVEGDNPPIAELGGGGAATDRQSSCETDRRPDSKRCMSSAWNRRNAERCRIPDRRI